MSRHYNKSTLLGNWFEDQQQEGSSSGRVYPDYGFREKTTVNKQDFALPSRRATQKEQPPRFGMVTADTFPQAQYAYKQSQKVVPSGENFGTVIPRAEEKEIEDDHFQTTMRQSFGGSGKPTHLEYLAEHSANMPPAGGPAGSREEKGMGGSGAIGERFKKTGDPKTQTVPQRSWVPWGDPGLRALEEKEQGRAPQPREAKEASLQITGASADTRVRAEGNVPGARTAAWRAPGRQNVITAGNFETSRRPGVNVWADE
eukprot:gb/GECG01002346.1/.p1 GENE.gb/GECG01002346.1/~~gb/GECG01002346.1/.p1  ORF type:complete len:258 (+),score=42.92 gb/GECG01002346.1/:1-774(+)